MTTKRNNPEPVPHSWEFKPRFRRHAFGWRSQPAITRIKEAVAEIKKVAKQDPLLAGEGAVLFIERLSPALEGVDSSSGSIGSAVNHAVAQLVPIIASAPADAQLREAWLERLFQAYLDDPIPYIECLGDHWGALCASKELASLWADRLIGQARSAWSPDQGRGGFFKGTTNCLSALLAAERYDDMLALLALAPYKLWMDRKYGVKALAGKGLRDQAIQYAEDSRGLNDQPIAIARACEELLLSAGLSEEAYQRYGLEANQAGTYQATFRAIAKKYPDKPASQILTDLVATTPGDEGKWFAAAKDAGLYSDALALASRTPCDPRTLTRAARDFAETQPSFALGSGLLALHWLIQGHGYEIISADVYDAYRATLAAGERLGRLTETQERIRQLLASEKPGGLVTKTLRRDLGF
jgi:hypothetical protein